MSLSSSELEQIVRASFFELPSISDEELYSGDLDEASSANEGLELFRNRGRYELLMHVEWIDFGVLYRLPPYAIWYFAPTFLLLAVRNLDVYEFFELMQPFRFPDHMLEEFGLDPYSSLESLDETCKCLRMKDQINTAGVGNDVKPASNGLGVSWFAMQAKFYTKSERAAVANFLEWLGERWPGVPSVVLARRYFWL
jgi:hypothetical protein